MTDTNDELQGWLRVFVDLDAQRVDQAAALLWGEGASGVEIRDSETFADQDEPIQDGHARAVAFFGGEHPEHLEAHLASVAASRGLNAHIRVHPFTDTSWKENWKRYFKPVQISPRLVVAPPWDIPALDEGTHSIIIEPGLAFGTGTHATTQLCLTWIDELLTDPDAIASMLDVGCGSGILSITAAKLASPKTRIDALDVDPEAHRVTTENLDINNVAGRVSLLSPNVAHATDSYDLVVANILSHILILLADDLVRTTRTQNGRLLLSGIGTSSVEEVRAAFQSRAMNIVEERTQDGWVAMLLTPHNAP